MRSTKPVKVRSWRRWSRSSSTSGSILWVVRYPERVVKRTPMSRLLEGGVLGWKLEIGDRGEERHGDRRCVGPGDLRERRKRNETASVASQVASMSPGRGP
jgi:hypothetical protein